MASALEERIKRLEALTQPFRDALRQLRDQVAGLKQQQFATPSGFGSGDGGGGGGVYFADHLSIAGMTAALSTLPTPPATTGNVYRISGGAIILAASGAAISNAMPDATDNTKRQILLKNTDGTYTVITQSCTSV